MAKKYSQNFVGAPGPVKNSIFSFANMTVKGSSKYRNHLQKGYREGP